MVLIIINKMCSDLVIFARKLSHPRTNVKHPRVIKSPQMSRINPPRPHKYPQGLDNDPIASYNTLITLTEHTYVGCVSESSEAAL
jgi:hypothetical protein